MRKKSTDPAMAAEKLSPAAIALNAATEDVAMQPDPVMTL